MYTHRVYVIWKHPLFYESIRLLLRNIAVEWLGASSSLIEARAEIMIQKPDTVLIEEEDGIISNQLIDILEGSTNFVRIFRLNLADNILRIYHREQRTVLQADDLIKLITEEK